ncbi:MAG: hypothetical protein AAGJ34_00810 [Pseudomonadota bacterium]
MDDALAPVAAGIIVLIIIGLVIFSVEEDRSSKSIVFPQDSQVSPVSGTGSGIEFKGVPKQ